MSNLRSNRFTTGGIFAGSAGRSASSRLRLLTSAALSFAMSVAAFGLAHADSALPGDELVAKAGLLSGAANQSGRLGPGDSQLNSGEWVKWYEYQGIAGSTIVITMTSSDFDSYVMVRGEGVLEDNDDGPGMGRDSRLEVTFPATGIYRIGVTTYAPGERGAYQLNVAPADAAGSIQQASAGQGGGVLSERGRLGPGDSQLNSGEWVKWYEYQATAGSSVIITMTSSEIDSYLMVRGEGLVEDNDDGPGMGLSSRLEITFPTTGVYRIGATTYAPGEQGTFQLSVAPAMPGGYTQQEAEDAFSGNLTLSGQLGPGNDQLNSDEWVVWYEYFATAGTRAVVTMTSNDFDAYVMVRGHGVIEDNDDGPGSGTNSRLEVTFPTTGLYRIGATTYAPGERGTFTLRVDL